MASSNHIFSPSAARIKTYVMVLFLITLFGLVGELLLIGHSESTLQKLPMILLVLSFLTLLWIRIRESKISRIAFRAIMTFLVFGGILGIWMHYSGNVEFELEMYPSLSGFDLMADSLTGATPVLAPGAIIGLGILGWIYTFLPSTISEK